MRFHIFWQKSCFLRTNKGESPIVSVILELLVLSPIVVISATVVLGNSVCKKKTFKKNNFFNKLSYLSLRVLTERDL